MDSRSLPDLLEAIPQAFDNSASFDEARASLLRIASRLEEAWAAGAAASLSQAWIKHPQALRVEWMLDDGHLELDLLLQGPDGLRAQWSRLSIAAMEIERASLPPSKFKRAPPSHESLDLARQFGFQGPQSPGFLALSAIIHDFQAPLEDFCHRAPTLAFACAQACQTTSSNGSVVERPAQVDPASVARAMGLAQVAAAIERLHLEKNTPAPAHPRPPRAL